MVGYSREYAAVKVSGRRSAAGTVGIAFCIGPYDYNYSIEHVEPQVWRDLAIRSLFLKRTVNSMIIIDHSCLPHDGTELDVCGAVTALCRAPSPG